ncbi:hypothetical protein GCM10025865_07320 [Paraoerskovia sediminicola]|uniref:Cupin n=1 Tax=Paraoerskovia sediminicola TaxID=1138587 RepID=A0ABM8G0B2_9CELL|nr:cupin [Paraoerskovia sediminicola]BDZ41433.1 hypothetical protein GCM10025865_07320 [Paraoerskovia sediminicola]
MARLDSTAADHLGRARTDAHGRSSTIVVHDGPLRQSVIALAAGTVLGEHNAPPAASLYVVEGLVRVTAASGDTEVGADEIVEITHERHSVEALEDSVFLLTTVTSIPKD